MDTVGSVNLTRSQQSGGMVVTGAAACEIGFSNRERYGSTTTPPGPDLNLGRHDLHKKCTYFCRITKLAKWKLKKDLWVACLMALLFKSLLTSNTSELFLQVVLQLSSKSMTRRKACACLITDHWPCVRQENHQEQDYTAKGLFVHTIYFFLLRVSFYLLSFGFFATFMWNMLLLK